MPEPGGQGGILSPPITTAPPPKKKEIFSPSGITVLLIEVAEHSGGQGSGAISPHLQIFKE